MIKGMKMPDSCGECPLHDGQYGWCNANNDIVMSFDERPRSCPLVEVPDAQTEKKSLNGDVIDRQAAIDVAHDWYEGLICGSFKGLEKRLRALPSAQPDYDKIIAEIKQCITETREHGKHHAKFVQDNGELYISGLEMALSIIEENR